MDHKSEVEDVVISVVREQLDLQVHGDIVPSSHLVRDLGLDSLSALCVFVELERRLQIDLTSVEIVRCKIVPEII